MLYVPNIIHHENTNRFKKQVFNRNRTSFHCTFDFDQLFKIINE